MLQPLDQAVEMPHRVAGAAAGVDLVGIEVEADRVAGLHHDIAEGGGEVARVLVLRRTSGGVVHRCAAVHDKVDAQVGLVLVPSDVVAVGAAEHLPVDELGIVAGHVVAMVGKLAAEPEHRTAMPSGEVPLHHVARLQHEAAEAAQIRRLQQTGQSFTHPGSSPNSQTPNLKSPIRNPQSAIRNPQSAIPLSSPPAPPAGPRNRRCSSRSTPPPPERASTRRRCRPRSNPPDRRRWRT